MDKYRNFRQYTLRELYESFGERFPETKRLLAKDVKRRIKKFINTLRKLGEDKMFKVYVKINCGDKNCYSWLPDVKNGKWSELTCKETLDDAQKEVAWMQNKLEDWNVEYKILQDDIEIWSNKK